MSSKKTTVAVSVIALLAIALAAGYLTRDRWMGEVPMMEKKSGDAFRVVTKEGAEFKECYVCPMHQQVIKPEPTDCPICGMSLVKKLMPLEGEKPSDARATQHGEDMKGAAATEKADGGMEHLMRISLDPRERMLANVATSGVVYRELSRDVYTVGRVKNNEKTVRKVTAWFPGRVERLYVDFTGQEVAKNQKIMAIYSPELISTEKEYLIARDAAKRLEGSDFPEVSKSTRNVLEMARMRMRLWGLTDAQIDEIDATGEVKMTIDVYSPAAGTVIDLMVREGNYVGEGSELYRLADLSSVWVFAEVYEYEFSKVGLGARVEVTADAYPGRVFQGKVSFVDPVVDTQSRTVGVRVELPNPGGLLKPEMFVNARILSKPRRVLSVPASAILYTGLTDVAWVEVEPGVFEHRLVKLGLRSGDEFEVLDGLKAGEMVVTQGGFLIDSEGQLKMGAGGGHAMHGMDMPAEKSPADKMDKMDMPAGHVH